MPFLLPAVTAAICDLGILYFHHVTYNQQQNNTDYIEGGEGGTATNMDGIVSELSSSTSRRIYQGSFIVPLAVIRLFLLFVPYPYHSFKGKALRCPLLYRAFYAITFIILFFYSLSLLLIDPKSLETLLPGRDNGSTSGGAGEPNNENSNTTKNGGEAPSHEQVTRYLWWSMILTFGATLSHVALFYHVRSTAPSDDDLFPNSHNKMNNGRRPTVLFYYVKKEHTNKELDNSSFHTSNNERGSLLRDGMQEDDDEEEDDDSDNDGWNDDEDEEIEQRGLLSNGKTGSTNNAKKSRMKKKKKRKPTTNSLVTIESTSTRSTNNNPMQDILIDLQTSLAKTKLEWTKRLEEYQFKSATRQHSGGVGVVAGTTGTQDSPSSMMMIQKVPPTPFRVVLELFAGEDVVSNGRLETVYNADDGTALMFFIPQILSFLLHGALESSPELEDWILDKCRMNVFFAHKCYWFLRAWTLESTNLKNGDGPPTPAMRLRKSSSLASFADAGDDLYDGSNSSSMMVPNSVVAKLLPEEYAVIEDLMQRIMECGEEPARLVHYGPMLSNNVSSDGKTAVPNDRVTPSPSALMTLAESGGIPIDPSSGMPSAKHFEFLAASRRYGFLPLDNSLTTNLAPLMHGNKEHSNFDATPVFLDALLTIADGLFKVPRELRSAEFRKQLNLLEVEALPSNDIYIPLQDPYHRVWRIVSDESIAISTKVSIG
jgi:hypothetical protein